MSSDKRPFIKVVMLGNSGVGKTSLVYNFLSYNDEKIKTTIAATHFRKKMSYKENEFELVLWDTAGQEQYQSLTPLYTRSASCAIIVVSMTEPKSFETIDTWIDILKQSCEKVPPIILAVNKIDLSSQNEFRPSDIVRQYEKKFTTMFFVSAISGENVNILFDQASQIGYQFAVNFLSFPQTLEENNSSCC